MKKHEPHYELLPLGKREWRFQESLAMVLATQRFDVIWERYQGLTTLGRQLRKFLAEHPQHIDGLHHFAMHRLDSGHRLDAYACAQAAVAVGKGVFPVGFLIGRDRLPGGFVQNRPFLRAMNGLMSAQAELNDLGAAIETASELLAFDAEDRMGVRLVLPQYLMETDRDEAALDIFTKGGFEDTFHTAEYLKALALFRLQKLDDATNVLAACLGRYPQVARFILEPGLENPPNDSRFGIASGSAFEGWYYARQYSSL